ncbi:MAG: right-handed parallel beta-helix repeat-containing protein, partial [Myxococcota bacterium]
KNETVVGVVWSTPSSFFVDARQPELVIFGLPDGRTTDDSFVLDIGGAAVDSYRYSFQGGPELGPFSADDPLLLGPLDPGTYTIGVIGISPSGIESAQRNVTITVLEEPPLSGEARILDDLSPSTSTFIDVAVGGPDVVSYEWRLCVDGVCEGVEYTGPISAADPLQFFAPEGEHVVEVVGINSNGERQEPPTRSVLVVDATPPTVVTTPVLVVTSLDDLVFTFSEPVDPSSISISGSLIPVNYPDGAVSGSEGNTVLTLAPPTLGWTVLDGSTPQTVTVEYADGAGNFETVEIELVVALDTAVVYPSFIPGIAPEGAYETIQDAVDNVEPGTLVQLVGGTYPESISLSEGDNVALLGGFNPDDPDERDPRIWPTVIRPYASPSEMTPVPEVSDYASPLNVPPDEELPPTDTALACVGADSIFSLIDGIEFRGPVLLGANCEIVFTGNRVLGQAPSGNGYGIYAHAGTTAQVVGNEIVGGSEDGASYAVYVVDAGQEFFLSSNSIDGGHGNPLSVGVYTHGSEPLVLDDNTITGGTGSSGGHPSRSTCNNEGFSIGVYMSNTRAQLSDNLVTGGAVSLEGSAPCNHTGASRSRGLYVTGLNSPPEQIFANGLLGGGSLGSNCNGSGSDSIGAEIRTDDNLRLTYTFVQGGHACDGRGRSTGVSIATGDDPVTLWNAIILGGTVSENTAIEIVDSPNVNVFNSLLFAEVPGTGTAVVSSGSNPELINNIIFGWDLGYAETAADSEPSVLSNNAIQSDSDTLYFDADTANALTSFAEIADQAPGATVSGNVDQGVQFVDADGPDDDPLDYLDNNWILSTATSCNVGMGGQVIALNPFGLETIDIDEVARTAAPECGPTNPGAAGWSMGVFEIDADFGREDLVGDALEP